MKLLLTNDDGYQSPLLRIAIRELRELPWLTELHVAVPDGEQSWKSHAMSGLGAINPRRSEVAGHPVTLVDGTPADCVDWAMHNLFDGFPDLVVSGVNCGHNTGLGFVMSSGTIGACWHANITDPPRAGLALSQYFADRRQHSRVRRGELEVDEERALAKHVARCLSLLWPALRARADFPAAPVTWSANFPDRPAPDLQVIEARIGDSRLEQCFQECNQRFEHSLVRYHMDPDPLTDGQVMQAGHISLTRIDLRVLCR